MRSQQKRECHPQAAQRLTPVPRRRVTGRSSTQCSNTVLQAAPRAHGSRAHRDMYGNPTTELHSLLAAVQVRMQKAHILYIACMGIDCLHAAHAPHAPRHANQGSLPRPARPMQPVVTRRNSHPCKTGLPDGPPVGGRDRQTRRWRTSSYRTPAPPPSPPPQCHGDPARIAAASTGLGATRARAAARACILRAAPTAHREGGLCGAELRGVIPGIPGRPYEQHDVVTAAEIPAGRWVHAHTPRCLTTHKWRLGPSLNRFPLGMRDQHRKQRA